MDCHESILSTMPQRTLNNNHDDTGVSKMYASIVALNGDNLLPNSQTHAYERTGIRFVPRIRSRSSSGNCSLSLTLARQRRTTLIPRDQVLIHCLWKSLQAFVSSSQSRFFDIHSYTYLHTRGSFSMSTVLGPKYTVHIGSRTHLHVRIPCHLPRLRGFGA